MGCPQLTWSSIETVLLDMDGTLLDLHFDNYFWQEAIPEKFASINNITLSESKKHLYALMKHHEGQLNWYCLDFWSVALQMDVFKLKKQYCHKIAILPYVLDFLTTLKEHNKQVLLVTNAHRKSLDLKMAHTGLSSLFTDIVSSHDYGIPKENPGFWQRLHQAHPFNRDSAVLIDDSVSVLRSAKAWGIGQLIAIHRPDSIQPPRTQEEFAGIDYFYELMPTLQR